MSTKKKRIWKILLILVCLLGPFVAWLGFGQQGLIQLYRTEMERRAYVERIQQLSIENQNLLQEIERLRTDMKYIETVARRELNLVKENDVIYRFKKHGAFSSGRQHTEGLSESKKGEVLQ